MPRTITIESYDEFALRHGNDALLIDKAGLIVFSDGASVSINDADVRMEPPLDPLQLTQMKVAYFREAVKAATEDFNRQRKLFGDMASMASRYDNLPGPPDNAKEILESMANVVHVLQGRVAELEAQLAVDEPDEEIARVQAYREQLAANRTRASEQLRDIQSVNV